MHYVPTVGRIVHFYDPARVHAGDVGAGPYAAIVAQVHTPHVVSLAVFSPVLGAQAVGAVLVHDAALQADPAAPTDRPYWTWPPRD